MTAIYNSLKEINFSALALPLAILTTALVFGLLEPAFLSADNMTGIVHRMATIGIMAVGMTFVIMTGGIDLSVGPVLALSGLISYFSLQVGLPLPVAVVAGLLSGVAVGALNGIAIAAFKLPAIIVTLGMLSIIRGTALIVGGPTLHQINGQPAYTFIGTGTLFGLPVSVWLFALIALIAIVIQNYTTYGLRVSTLGDNELASELSGQPSRRLKASTYMVCGATAALAGIIGSSQVYTASASFGEFGTELDVIAAVILGGASLFGGKAYVWRTVLGVIFLGIINSGLNILNIPVDVQLMAKGAIIVLAISMSNMTNKARR